MGLSKKAISTTAICCLCCILLGVLVALGYSGKVFVSSLSICVMTNAITGIYSYAFSGKKSFVFIAMLSFAINMAFLILRIKGAYPKQCAYPSDGELVGTITLLIASLIWIRYSLKLLHKG